MKQKIEINKNDFFEGVSRYELTKNCMEYIEQVDGYEELHIFKTSRGKKKIVFFSQHSFLIEHLKQVISRIIEIVEDDNKILTNVDIFTTSVVSPTIQKQIDDLLTGVDLAAKTFDFGFIEKDEAFAALFPKEEARSQNEEISHVLYDYLASGNDSAFIKNSLKYTIILFAIYQHPGISVQELVKELKDNCPNLDSTIKQDISYLRLKNKIKKKDETKTLNGLELTYDECYKIECSVKEHQVSENAFLERFTCILKKYNLEDTDHWLCELKELYKQYYIWNFDDRPSNNYDTNERSNNALSEFKLKIKKNLSDEDKVDTCICELEQLCSSSSYLNRLTLSESFLSLYKNNKYDEYINDRINRIILDTPAFIYFMIVKSDLDLIPEFDFNDEKYDVIKSLTSFKDHSNNTEFYIPYDYVGEAYGEYQKALRLSVFDKIDNFPIEIQSANTFFNHYLAIKKQMQQCHEDTTHFHFEDYALKFGFPCISLDDMNLQYKTIEYIRTFADSLECDCIPMIKERYDGYDEVKKEYENTLKEKTESAVKADVRQSFYITLEAQKPENINADYYLATWDGTLSDLRDKVKKYSGVKRSYSVRKPNLLLNTLSLKSFKIKPEAISKGIFSYADTSYSLRERIQSIFDNILVPYFSGLMNRNAELPNAIIKMQQELLDNGHDGDSFFHNKYLPLEDIFFKIDKALLSNSCSHQDLRNFLSDSSNNEMLVKLFSSAFDSYKSGNPIDISSDICKAIKKAIAKEEEADSFEKHSYYLFK